MDRRITKLNHRVNDLAAATALVEAGIDSPKKIKATTQKEIEKHIGKAKAKKVKDKIK